MSYRTYTFAPLREKKHIYGIEDRLYSQVYNLAIPTSLLHLGSCYIARKSINR